MKDHPCLCDSWDGKWCPECHQKCHHDTPLGPKVLVAPM